MMWNSSLHLLRTRDFKRGWECWELGFAKEVGTMGRNLIPQVKVLPRADKNKDFDPEHWTLVVVEQGIGDQILFLSVMEEAINEFKNIFLIVEARMKSIIERSFPNLQVGLPGLLESWQSNALKKMVISLWVVFLEDIGSQWKVLRITKKHFLQVNGDLYVQYQQQLKSIANGRPIVGLSWSGGYWAAQKRAKGLAIENWLPIFERGALCVNLQYGDTSKEEAISQRKRF